MEKELEKENEKTPSENEINPTISEIFNTILPVLSALFISYLSYLAAKPIFPATEPRLILFFLIFSCFAIGADSDELENHNL